MAPRCGGGGIAAAATPSLLVWLLFGIGYTSVGVVSSSSGRPPPNKLVTVKTNCTRDVFNVKLDLAKPFRGVIFAKDFLDECRTLGNRTATVVMSMPTAGCGIRSEHRDDGTYELSVKLVMQMDGKLRQMSDIKTVVRCVLPASMMSINVDVGVLPDGRQHGSKAVRRKAEQKKEATAKELAGARKRLVVTTSGLRNGRMKQYGQVHNNPHNTAQHHYVTGPDDEAPPPPPSETATALPDSSADEASSDSSAAEDDDTDDDEDAVAARRPRVRVWMELGGGVGGTAGAVEVGEQTTFAVRAVLPGNIGVRVVDCAALDGIGETSQKLLDDRGCPVDEQVMPALFTRLRPMEEGWSKPHPDDLVEKLFSATFAAFKFPDRERLHLSCGVQLCTVACPDVDCADAEAPFVLGADRHLARIEVFNSLTVTAPKIDLDRMRALSLSAGGGGSGGGGAGTSSTMGGGAANVTVEEYAAGQQQQQQNRLRANGGSSDGILCMSTSRLALAFCVLGLIFLVAVVVAVYCLLRARQRRFGRVAGSGSSAFHGSAVGGCMAVVGRPGTLHSGRRLATHLRAAAGTGTLMGATTATTTGSTSIFSSSSGSQSRFGGKLIIAPGGSLPYGRVY